MDIRFDEACVRIEGREVVAPLTLVLNQRRVGIVGLNGSGKTTFARMINGLTKPTAGHVTVGGLDTVADAKAVLAKVGFIFQNPQNQIILPIIRDDIGFGLKNRGMPQADIEHSVDAILDRFGISALAGRRAHELSGGELQLAALCAVLVTGPDVLILDEPTNQLDLRNRRHVEEVIETLDETVLVISHDLALLERFDRVLVFDRGGLVADDAPEQAIAHYREIAAR